jgi:hypothetical protein
MSLVEMRERLELQGKNSIDTLKSKHDDIINEKREKQRQIVEKIEILTKC